MYCKKCYAELPDDTVVCPECGEPTGVIEYVAPQEELKEGKFNVPAFIAFLSSFFTFAIAGAVFYLVFGFLGWREMKKYSNKKGKKLLIAGLIIGIIEIVLFIVLYVGASILAAKLTEQEDDAFTSSTQIVRSIDNITLGEFDL